MKKLVGGFLSASFILLAFFAAPAQERKKISDEEYAAASKNYSLKGKSYRLRRSSKSYKKVDDSLISYFEEVTEYLSSGDSRSVVLTGSNLKNLMRNEFIRIGQTGYSKGPFGTWRQYQLQTASAADQSRYKSEGETTAEHFYLGRTLFNIQPAELYESRFVTKTMTGGAETTKIVTTKKWIRTDGMILRIESREEFGETYSLGIFEFEYDPNIKIEAPMK